MKTPQTDCLLKVQEDKVVYQACISLDSKLVDLENTGLRATLKTTISELGLMGRVKS